VIIYKIRNKINNKIYIGQTINSLERRTARHLKSNSYIGNALRKNGIQSFDISIIDTADDINLLNEKEEYWISYYNTICPDGYNLSYGGNNSGMSEETKRKLRKPKPDGFRNSGMFQKGGHTSTEFKKGIHPGTEWKKGRVSWNNGLVGYRAGHPCYHGEDTGKKISIANTGNHPSNKTRKQMSKSQKRRRRIEKLGIII